MTQNNLLESALEYVEKYNWFIFPTRSVDGKPFFRDGKTITPRAKSPLTRGGLNDASNEPEQIRKWWQKFPRAGIGVNCGKSKIFAVDIDSHQKGRASGLEYFMSLNVPHRNAWTSLTPSGGIHLIYSDENSIGRTTTDDTNQIDQRGRGGYIIVAPSVLDVIFTSETVEIIEGEEVRKITMVKEKRAYTKIGEWEGLPMEITPFYLKLLNKRKTTQKIDLDFEEYLDGISKQDVERVFKCMRTMPISVAHNRNDWIAIGSVLKLFGKRGWLAFEWWSNKYLEEKPESNRAGTLEQTWKTFTKVECTIGTIFYHHRNNDG